MSKQDVKTDAAGLAMPAGEDTGIKAPERDMVTIPAETLAGMEAALAKMEAMQAELEKVEAMQAELAKVEAMQAELEEMRKAQESQQQAAPAARTVAKPKPPKMVTVKLPKHRKMLDDVYVSVNGERYLIQRGVEVPVPDYVAEVLAHSETQDNLTMELKAQLRAKIET